MHLCLEDFTLSSAADLALQWAIMMANDQSHGYDQDVRWGPDYDCSSFVISAYKYGAGLPIDTSQIYYTGNMSLLLNMGFVDVTSQINLSNGAGLIKGDILLNHVHHTEMYAGNGQDIGAYINELGTVTGGQTGDQGTPYGYGEIDFRPYRNYPWNAVYRYGGTAGYQWVQREVNTYDALSQTEIYGNAVLTYYELVDLGFSTAAAAGVLGNIQYEGQFNPAQWQGGYPIGSWYEPYCGYGMFQYTPPHKYYQDWAQGQGVNLNDPSSNGPMQVKWLDANPGQFNGSSIYMTGNAHYGITYSNYKLLTDPADAANVWLRAWELPADPNGEQPKREAAARYWYNEIINNFPYNPGGDTPGVVSRTQVQWIPAVIMERKRNKRIY